MYFVHDSKDCTGRKRIITFSEIFTQHVSNISLEVEAIKLRNLRNDTDGINEHLARIESALIGIMEARLGISRKSFAFPIKQLRQKSDSVNHKSFVFLG